MRQLNDAEFARAAELFALIQEQLQAGNLSLQARIDLMEKLRALQDVFGVGGDVTVAETDEPGKEIKEALDQIRQEAGLTDRALGQVALALITGGREAFAQLAKFKALENVARAIEETAKGVAASFWNPPAAAAHFAAAKTFAVAAAAWGALGGTVGAFAGRGGGRGTAFGGGAVDTAGRERRRDTQIGELVFVIDGVDPGNPRHQRRLAQTTYEASRRGLKVSVRDGGIR